LFSDADEDAGDVGSTWLSVYWTEFRRRVLQLFGYEFAKFPAHLALSILQLKNTSVAKHLTLLSRSELALFLSNGDLRRLAQYARNMVDYHLITDLVPTLALLYFNQRFSADVCLHMCNSIFFHNEWVYC
uniref:Possible tRNA binding domain-containing protein n=1 Tax=Parascaris equorum TaxID=6256 RepID=A0A914RNB2_PAREQ